MFSKVGNLIKMTWMFSWRLIVLNFLFSHGQNNRWFVLIAFIISAVLVFGFNKHVLIFPIIRLIKRSPVIQAADGSEVEYVPRPSRPRPPKQKHKRNPELVYLNHGVTIRAKHIEYVASAKDKGRMTGFEPKHLEDLPMPRSYNMVGVPGEGLIEATHFEKENIQLGQMGEENFAKVLNKTHHLNRFKTAWSVPVPDQKRLIPGPYGTDIDCILATHDNLYLIDLKNYKSGDVRYHVDGSFLYTEDRATGKQVGESKEMSHNMEMATAAMKHHFPRVNIVPVVVFMPTNNGEGFIDNVYWPGNIRAVSLSQFITELSFQKDFSYEAPTSGAFVLSSSLIPKERLEAKKKDAPIINWYEDSTDWEDEE